MRRIAVLLAAALLAGCGPSALERRACDMYHDAGGGTAHPVEWWIEVYSRPGALDAANAAIARENESIEQINEMTRRLNSSPSSPPIAYDEYITPQSRAKKAVEDERSQNRQAQGIVSIRLSLSMHEIEVLLEKCVDERRET